MLNSYYYNLHHLYNNKFCALLAHIGRDPIGTWCTMGVGAVKIYACELLKARDNGMALPDKKYIIELEKNCFHNIMTRQACFVCQLLAMHCLLRTKVQNPRHSFMEHTAQ